MQCDHAEKDIWISVKAADGPPKTQAKQAPRKQHCFKEETGALRRCTGLALLCYIKHDRKEVSGGVFLLLWLRKQPPKDTLHAVHVYTARCF